VKKGDRVIVYMPTSPYVVASMMACARIGAVHRSVYLLLYPSLCFYQAVRTWASWM